MSALCSQYKQYISVLPVCPSLRSLPVRPRSASFSPKAYRFHADYDHPPGEVDWPMIYKLALRSKDSLDFLQMLKIGGFRRIGGTASAADAQGNVDKDSTSLQPEPADGRMIKNPQPRAHHRISRGEDNDLFTDAAKDGRYPARPGGEAEGSLPEVAADGGPLPLSRRLAHKCAINGTIVITLANYALWDFVKSWAHHVKGVGALIR